MKLLILGGTRFLGRHLAEQALQRGHALTLLHRGRSGPALFPEATHMLADRDGDLSVLDGGTWDAVIDTSAYVPRQVRAAAARLAGRVGSYQLVSTISVYSDFADPGLIEDAPLARLADETTETVDGGTYGGLKALCEQAALDAYGERGLIARPGLLVGPHDPTGRFTWWATRLQRGGEVLAPGEPASPVQFIDTRDAAAWLLLQAERQAAGTFNLTGPCRPAGEPPGFVLLNILHRTEPCAGLDLQPRLLGARAAEMVVGQILRSEFGIPAWPSRTTVQARWVEGPTVRALPAGPPARAAA